MDLGRFNIFRWHRSKSDISQSSIYTLGHILFSVPGSASAKVINLKTGAETSMTATPVSWTINGQSLSATILGSAPANGNYYIALTKGGVTTYSDVINITSATCIDVILINNSCDTFVLPFTSMPSPILINIFDGQHDAPTTETSFETIITETGDEKKLSRQITKHHVWFVQPKWYRNILTLLSVSDTVTINGTAIKNIDFTEEAIDEEMSQFTIKYEFRNLQEGNDCCEIINLDDISNPDGGGDDCGLSVSISESGGTLTATASGYVDSVLFKWYRDGIFLTNAASISITVPGNYTVVATESGCRATDSYFLENECLLLSVKAYASGNFLNADINGVPTGCTPTIKIILNGTVVGSTLPFEVSESGTYFVKVDACGCNRSSGVYIKYSEDNCAFSLSIAQNGNTLESTTDAGSPTYLWEIETGSGKTTIGSTANITITERGIYWLTVTDGGCAQTIYKYLEPLASSGIFVRQGGTGTVWTIAGINLANYPYPSLSLRVTINGVVFTYVAGVPTMPNTYGIDGSGKLLTPTSLTNPTIIIELI